MSVTQTIDYSVIDWVIVISVVIDPCDLTISLTAAESSVGSCTYSIDASSTTSVNVYVPGLSASVDPIGSVGAVFEITASGSASAFVIQIDLDVCVEIDASDDLGTCVSSLTSILPITILDATYDMDITGCSSSSNDDDSDGDGAIAGGLVGGLFMAAFIGVPIFLAYTEDIKVASGKLQLSEKLRTKLPIGSAATTGSEAGNGVDLLYVAAGVSILLSLTFTMFYEISTVYAYPGYNFVLAVWALFCICTPTSQRSVLGLLCFLGLSIFTDIIFLAVWTSEDTNLLLPDDDAGSVSAERLQAVNLFGVSMMSLNIVVKVVLAGCGYKLYTQMPKDEITFIGSKVQACIRTLACPAPPHPGQQ